MGNTEGGTAYSYTTRRLNAKRSKNHSNSRNKKLNNLNINFGKNFKTPAELNQPGSLGSKAKYTTTTPLAHQDTEVRPSTTKLSKYLKQKHGNTANKAQFGRKNTKLEIIHFNCQGLASEGRVLELENTLNNQKFDILGLSEIRRERESIVKRNNGNFCFYYGKTKGYRGGGFLYTQKMRKKYDRNPGNFQKDCTIKN